MVLIEADFVLLIEFVVGGQDQSPLVSGSDVAYLIMFTGPRLAMDLSNVVGCNYLYPLEIYLAYC